MEILKILSKNIKLEISKIKACRILSNRKIKKNKNRLPDEFVLPNPYNIPVHDQGFKCNCTSHSIALAVEYQLSNKFKQLVLVDADDLWEKQKKYGTAKEDEGDTIEDAVRIAHEYGVIYKKSNGETGLYKPTFVKLAGSDKKQ